MTLIRIKDTLGDFTYTVDETTVSATGTVFLEGTQSFGFNLDQISPTPIVLERRHPNFGHGFYWLAGGLAALALHRKLPSEDARVLALCAGVATVRIGLLLIAVFMRKIRIIMVTNHGGQPLFSIVRTPRNSGMWTSFWGCWARKARHLLDFS